MAIVKVLEPSIDACIGLTYLVIVSVMAGDREQEWMLRAIVTRMAITLDIDTDPEVLLAKNPRISWTWLECETRRR
ncbi:hypothetical protein HK100_012288, partial [Physocladia obscura]